jgi:hypothetical protein
MSTLHQDNAFFEIALENLPRLLMKFNKLGKVDYRSFEEKMVSRLNNDPVDRACDIALSNRKFKAAVSGIDKIKKFKSERVSELKEDINERVGMMEHTPGKKSFFGKIFRTVLDNL